MRTGAQSVQQALTLEAASVLKQSLSLARRRGHAQVTPLHVAATLLSFSPSSSCFPSPNVLRRACLKSHPHYPSSHPLQCRALELCFNVALNRLPTIPPPSSGPLTHPHPSLSNALIAALKRAQAHQRRGSIEQQQQQPQQPPPPPQQQQQQQQPLLAIKVELEQLIISILDDPSVSRVMREAGFSSTCVKANIEEYSLSSSSSSSSSSCSPCSSSSTSSSHREFINQVLKPSQKEDLKVVFEVMLRKQGKRNNTVVVGDSLVSTEGLVTELICRIERGVDVPDELKCCHALRFHLSSLHLRLMSKTEIEIKVSELKKKISFLANGSSGVIVYVGDLKWVVDEEIEVLGFKPVEFMVAELQRLLIELKSFKVWLMATANYQTYIKCQTRQPSLENQWGLQAVVVPSGGLALSLQASSVKEEQEKLICCPECTLNYEKEASFYKHNSNSNMNETSLPSWLQIHRLDYNQKDALFELKRKWSRLCQSLHCSRNKQMHLYPPLFGSSNPWLLSNSVTYLTPDRSINSAKQWLSELSLCSLKKCTNTDVRTTLALSNPLISDSATSKDSLMQEMDDDRKQELRRRLEENISGHSEIIPSIMDALLDCVSTTTKKGASLLIEGSDHIAKQRIEGVLVDWFGDFSDRTIVKMDMKVSAMSENEFIDGVIGALSKHSRCVFFIDGIDQTQANLAKSLSQIGMKVNLANAIFVLITASDGDSSMNVLKLKLYTKENNELKRKQELQLPNKSKRAKMGENELRLDLNISAEDEQDVPSDITQETDTDNGDIDMPRITLNSDPAKNRQLSEKLTSKLRRAFEEIQESAGEISVDSNTVKRMVKACGTFTEQVFDEWVKQVFQTSLLTVKKGGNVWLCLDSNKEGDVIGVVGFQGSCLPKTIYVD